jgi:ankyrin repeat protein
MFNRKKFNRLFKRYGCEPMSRDEKSPFRHVSEEISDESILLLVIKELIEVHGVDVNTLDEDGLTCLFYITDENVQAYLLAHGADVNIQSEDGETALFYITEENALKNLLAHGADVNIQSEIGETALTKCFEEPLCDEDHTALLLLEAGANPNHIAHSCGYGALHYASTKYAVDILVDHGANINLIGKDGNTPLHHAIRCGKDDEVIDALVNRGADLFVKNNKGQTCAQLLCAKKESEKQRQLMDGEEDADE